MMMLEKHKSYNTFREFNQKYPPIIKDLNPTAI